MTTYSTPVEDILFLLHDVLAIEQQDLPGFADLTPDMTRPIIEGAGAFQEEVVFPLNLSGDAEGVRLENGQVRTPKGFKEAFRRFCDDGWNRTTVPEEMGGMGLPTIMRHCLFEIASAANFSFSMYSNGAASFVPILLEFAPQWLSSAMIPKLVHGECTGTMCLTEPNAGTDLRLMKTRAVPQGDGTFLLSGTKIFISAGDHDLTDNILHLVLAKIANAQGQYVDDLGTVGCFLVPKRGIDPQTGAAGASNGVSVGSIEKKMGLKASATCVLNFDEAVAWPMIPAGAPRDLAPGMEAMFRIMNGARLSTAISALGIASVAAQSAADYARERLQGRALGKRADTTAAADPLIAQPDVRRLLLESASFVEGARATILWASLQQCIAANGKDEAERGRADDLIMLLQPVLKAYFSDKGFDVCNASLQVFGGHGYVHDHGMEQLVRDSRVQQIYEGANGVQAFDLVARRLRSRNHARTDTFFDAMDAIISDNQDKAEMAPYVAGLSKASDAARNAVAWLGATAPEDMESRAGVSYDVMTLFGIAVVALSWTRIARVALDQLEGGSGNEAFLRRKLLLARIWMEREVPLTAGLTERIANGAASLMEAEAERV